MLTKTHKKPLVMLRVKQFLIALIIAAPLIFAGAASADSITCSKGNVTSGGNGAQYCCGGGSQAVAVSINFGCQGKGNPIADMLFAVIRFLSDGVGLVIIASLIVAGIQYTSSRGDPQATARAIHRVQGNVSALFLFLFAYAILNYVVPGAIL